MNNLLLCFSLVCLSFPNYKTENKAGKQPTLIKEDFFEKSENIKISWLGNLQSIKTNKSISNIPMFIYRDAQLAYAKIICIPIQPKEWNSKFKGKTLAQKTSITRTLAKGILNHAFGEKKFTIYAFLQKGNDKKGITVVNKNNVTVFPATIYIYKNAGTNWNLVTQKAVANSSAYQQLQYDIALTSVDPKAI